VGEKPGELPDPLNILPQLPQNGSPGFLIIIPQCGQAGTSGLDCTVVLLSTALALLSSTRAMSRSGACPAFLRDRPRHFGFSISSAA